MRFRRRVSERCRYGAQHWAYGAAMSVSRHRPLFTLYFLALLLQALIERELRQAMQRERIAQLPIYPEQRSCKRPTTAQVLRLFSLAECHTLTRGSRRVQVFQAELTPIQRQVIELLGVRSGRSWFDNAGEIHT
jgi:hypothetical protein